MAKKNTQETEEQDATALFSLQLTEDTKRSIGAIFSFVFGLVFVLGFFEQAGIIGSWFDRFSAFVFGWGKWLFPLLLFGFTFILLRKRIQFYMASIIGLSFSFLSVLGIFHLTFGQEAMREAARDGVGGGYVGFGIAKIFLLLIGDVASWVLLFALLTAGVLVAFNSSLIPVFQKGASFLKFFVRKKKSQDDSEEQEETPSEESRQEGEAEASEAKEQKEGSNQENEEEASSVLPKNVASLRFDNEEQVEEESSEETEDEADEQADIPMYIRKTPKKDKNRALQKEWRLPPMKLLERSSGKAKAGDIDTKQEIIQETLGEFGVEVEPDEVKIGPTVTQYCFRPARGVRLEKITSLSSNLALALAAQTIRVEAPIPGKSLVGIEVPNKSVATVRLREMIESKEFQDAPSPLTISLGKDVSGEYVFADLAKMPHLLVAGSTGSGKSVCINSILLSLLYKNTPDDLKLILVDPKRVELSMYGGISHLKTPVIVENKKVIGALKWAVGEMEKRYQLLQSSGSRNLESYNEKVDQGLVPPEEDDEDVERLPYIVIVIDELADLMVSHGKEVESAIVRLAQMARAVGIHLIVSTQRPSVEVLTGLIKSNITNRVAFKVATQIDSRTILDKSGAEKLLGNGDMLFASPSMPAAKRLQGVLITEDEVRDVTDFLKMQSLKKGEDQDDQEDLDSDGETTEFSSGDEIDLDSYANESEHDELYEEARGAVIQSGKASTSFLQRRFRIGYNRAARIMDELEVGGVVGPQDGSRPRPVLLGAKASEDAVEYDDPIEDQKKREGWE